MKLVVKKALKFALLCTVIGIVAGYFTSVMMFSQLSVEIQNTIISQTSQSTYYIL